MVEIFQDIRKIYIFSAPCHELSDFIEFYSESSLTESLRYFKSGFSTVKMFPSWTPTFYINLGTPYYIDLKHHRQLIERNEDILILRNDDVTRCKPATDHIGTVKCSPGGLDAVFGLNQTAMADQVINLNQILPLQLLQQIKQPITFEERVILMQSYLLAALGRNNISDHYIQLVNKTIGEYTQTGMHLNTGTVAERHFITSKTINRYFNRVIGLSPKSYFSILRARTALTAYVKDRDNFAPFNYGYYDLSHFSKDVVKFTGQTLTQSLS